MVLDLVIFIGEVIRDTLRLSASVGNPQAQAIGAGVEALDPLALRGSHHLRNAGFGQVFRVSYRHDRQLSRQSLG